MPWCTEECYQQSCGETKTTIFLVCASLVILALLGFAIYLVAKPVQCKDERMSDKGNRILKQYYKKPPKCRETSILLYPQLAAIVENGTQAHICSGAILSKNWMATAAHCLILCNAGKCDNFIVRAGSSHTNRGGKLYNIIQFELHPQFNSTTLQNNIGLIKVHGFHLNNRNIKAAKVSSVPLINRKAELLGWAPYSKVDIIYRDNVLKMINLTLEPHAVCTYRMKGGYSKFTVTDYMLCGTYSTKGEGCYTDAGGPLMVKDVLNGIAMFGQICYSCDYHMSILTNIYNFRNFIQKFTTVQEVGDF